MGAQPRVLCIPHGFRSKFFSSFLDEVRRQNRWSMAILCEEASRRAFAHLVDSPADLIFLPDFGRRGAPADPALRELITACERTSRISANRLLLTGERDIGRAYSKDNYFWTENALARRALKDSGLAQHYLDNLFRFAVTVLDRVRPDFVICGMIAGPLNMALSLVCQQRDIPVVCNRWSKVTFGRCFWTLDRFMGNTAAAQAYGRLAEAAAPTSKAADAFLREWRDRPHANTFVAANWQRMNVSHRWLKWHRTVIDLAVAKAVHILKRRRGQLPKEVLPKLAEYYVHQWLRRVERRYVKSFTFDELAGMRYVFVSLHKEPEQALNFQCYPFYDQRNLVRVLSALMPYGVRLLVREHKGTSGRRRGDYLRSLAQLPGVTVIDPLDDQFKYILNAAAIVTDNGSVGFEGLMARRPVVTLAENFYSPTGLARHVTDLFQLNDALLSTLDDAKLAEDHDRRLGWLYDAEMATTVPNDDTSHASSIAVVEALARR